MKRGRLHKLREPRWSKVTDDDPLEICIIPGAASSVNQLLLMGGGTSDAVKEEICTKVFVDYRGYTEDDGTEIPNSLESRMELYEWSLVRQKVNGESVQAQMEIAEGEGSAD